MIFFLGALSVNIALPYVGKKDRITRAWYNTMISLPVC